jgi:hypothetical protein
VTIRLQVRNTPVSPAVQEGGEEGREGGGGGRRKEVVGDAVLEVNGNEIFTGRHTSLSS